MKASRILNSIRHNLKPILYFLIILILTTTFMTDPHQPLQILKKIQHYSFSLTDKLGQGFSSKVYTGTNDISNDRVAIKVINLKDVNQIALPDLLNAQINILDKMKHANVVGCLDVFITVNNCYIVMEYCNGGDLASFLGKKGRFREMEAVNLMKQICDGVRYIHQQNVLHRDIKPANILLHNNIPKIADFGFAKYYSGNPKRQKLQIGSPLYMSPKAILETIYTPMNDVWALGIVFYEMIEGKAPWNVRNQKELKQAIKGPVKFRILQNQNIKSCIQGMLAYEESSRWSLERVCEVIQGQLEKNDILETKAERKTMDQDQQQGQQKKKVEIVIKQPQQEKQIRYLTNKQQVNKQNIRPLSIQPKNIQPSHKKQTSQLQIILLKDYSILKWMINYSRFIYKLILSVEKDLVASFSSKITIIEFCMNILYLMIEKMMRLELMQEEFQAIGFRFFDEFKKTIHFSKIQAVTKQYYERFNAKFKQYNFGPQRISFQNYITPSRKFLIEFNYLSLTDESKENHNMTIDKLVTLLVVNYNIKTIGMENAMKGILFDKILDTIPAKLEMKNLEELVQKRRLISQYVQDI